MPASTHTKRQRETAQGAQRTDGEARAEGDISSDDRSGPAPAGAGVSAGSPDPKPGEVGGVPAQPRPRPRRRSQPDGLGITGHYGLMD